MAAKRPQAPRDHTAVAHNIIKWGSARVLDYINRSRVAHKRRISSSIDISMNRLQAARIYLCGPIENHQNDFAQWRTIITKSLNNSIDNIVIWDPIIKPSWLINEDREALDLAFNKQLIYHNYYKIDKPPIGDRIWNINPRARQICQGLAGSCDILIARLTKTFSWGSVDELEVAIRRHIPVFIWFADERVGIYGLPGIADNE